MEKLTEKIVEKYMRVEGQTRGALPKSYGEYILEQEGEEGLERLENKLAEVGCHVKFKKINSMGFMPVGKEAIILIAIKELFDYKDERFDEIGEFHVKTVPPIIRMFGKFFGNIEKVAPQGPVLWKKQYTVGVFETELDKENKSVTARIKNFKLHPLHCRVLKGYYRMGLQIVTKSSKATCKEVKCPFGGDEYHEYLLEW